MITRWESWGVATLLVVSLLVAPRLALAQGLASFDIDEVQGNHMNSVAAGTGVANPLGLDSPPVSNLSLKNSLSLKERAKIGMDAAPGLIKAAQIPCTLSEARFMFAAIGADKGRAKVYEVACQEGLGYVLIAKDKNPVPDAVDCIKLSTKSPDGKPNPLACKLPGNRHPALGLQSVVAKAGHTCTVSNGRYVGSTTAADIYEVACTEGGGYVLETSRDGSAAPKTTNCVIYGSGGGIKCSLTTDAQQNSYVDKMVAASGKPCTIAGRRYVGSTPDGADFYEVSCSDKTGFMIKTAANGGFGEATDCLKAAGIGGGCTLTDTRQAQTQQTALYSNLSKKAGFGCDVSKYADFPSSDANVEIVEVACSNRPEGGVGFFPAGAGQPRVLDCLRSEAEGYKCSFTPTSALFSKLTAQLRAKGKTSCVVSDAVAFAEATSKGGVGKDDLVEVACADGGPGYVIDYLYGQTEPAELLNCAQVASMGGCKLSKMK